MNAAIQFLLPLILNYAQSEIDAINALPTQAAKRKQLMSWLSSTSITSSPGGYLAAAVVRRSVKAQDMILAALSRTKVSKPNPRSRPVKNPTRKATTVQSLVFDRASFNVDHAKAWAKAHGFRFGSVDVQPTTIRLRQQDPSHFRTFRTKELAQGVQAVIARNPRRNPPITNKLLAHMLALRTAYQYAHWNAKNYADHLLFEKLYTSLDGGIDILAEISQQHVEPVATPSITDRGLMKAEDKIIAFAQDAVENDRPDPGFENFLLGLIEHRERAKYLLAQRSDKAANRDAEARERREAALEGDVYKNPKRRRNSAVTIGSRVRVPQEHSYTGTVVAIGPAFAGGQIEAYLVRFGSGREIWYTRDEIEPVR